MHLYLFLSSHFFLNTLSIGTWLQNLHRDRYNAGHEMISALLHPIDQFPLIIHLDPSAAFDPVDYPFLLESLSSFGFQKNLPVLLRPGPHRSQNVDSAAFNWSKQITKTSLDLREGNPDRIV